MGCQGAIASLVSFFLSSLNTTRGSNSVVDSQGVRVGRPNPYSYFKIEQVFLVVKERSLH
ncbi:MAG: hypothetical protein F6K40_01195 [Okeania sp. SIO3I5]|uniref:hypothetical protein n=1 Tax=Okeania sp. SIO3I5 TaxID=2607805 RepID=UPI0013BC03E4|nr:hypothetical protein [Okeania sp. SIO3I5]NEQ34999.1 hypothetical protein [Okeania sp. SIO3I5]